MLKLVKIALPIGLLIGVSLICMAGFDNLDLEPCINGEVSASGAFPSDAAERQFYAAAEQEPCMNGDVPPDGVLATDRLSEAVDQIVAASRP